MSKYTATLWILSRKSCLFGPDTVPLGAVAARAAGLYWAVSMETTHQSLLERVKNPADQTSWNEFYRLYSPILVRYARQHGLNRHEAEDIMQECMRLLVKEMPRFKYCRSRGRFKAFLRTLANNTLKNSFRRRRPRPAKSGELSGLAQSEQQSAWDDAWLREHLSYCLKRVETKFSPDTRAAFRYHVLLGWPVEKVCRTLGITENQVYLAKSRVTKRLRSEMHPLVGVED